jgi:hypothetical protein
LLCPALLLRFETSNQLGGGVELPRHLSLAPEKDVKLVLLDLLGGIKLFELLCDLLEGSHSRIELFCSPV